MNVPIQIAEILGIRRKIRSGNGDQILLQPAAVIFVLAEPNISMLPPVGIVMPTTCSQLIFNRTALCEYFVRHKFIYRVISVMQRHLYDIDDGAAVYEVVNGAEEMLPASFEAPKIRQGDNCVQGFPNPVRDRIEFRSLRHITDSVLRPPQCLLVPHRPHHRHRLLRARLLRLNDRTLARQRRIAIPMVPRNFAKGHGIRPVIPIPAHEHGHPKRQHDG